MFQHKTRYSFVAVVVLFVPLLLWRDFTPDNELRYLSIADEALHNGSVFAFSNHGVPYADKPPLYLWLLMACRWLLGGWHLWALGLLSLVPACLTAAAMNRWTRSTMPCEHRLPAIAMLLATGLFLGSAIVVRMDMLMTLFIVLAVWEFHKQYTRVKRSERTDFLTETCATNKTRDFPENSALAPLLFPLLLFLALFTKGPLGVLIPLAGITLFLATKRELRLWPRFFGLKTWAVLLGLSALWFLAVYVEGGSEYLDNLLFHQTMDRAVNAFHHKRPLWYYIVSFTYSFAPWTLLVIRALVASLRQRPLKTDLERLLLCMTASTFLLLTAISSKLAIYMLPMLPFTVYLTMLRLPHFDGSPWARLCLALPAAALAVALPIFLFLTRQEAFAHYAQVGFFVAAGVLSAVGVCALCIIANGQPLHRAITIISCGLGLAVFSGGFSISKLNPCIGYGSACREAKTIAEERRLPILVDKRLKNAADMDVYLGRFRLVDADSLLTSHAPEPALLITKGDGGKRLKTQVVGASQ